MFSKMRPWRRNGPNGAKSMHMMSPKRGFLFPEKMVWRFRGGATARGMSPKRGFFFPEKMVWRFRGMQRRAACPKIGVSSFRKKWFGVFGGCNGAPRKMWHVPKSGFLIWKKTWLDSTTFFKLSVFDMWPPFYINGGARFFIVVRRL